MLWEDAGSPLPADDPTTTLVMTSAIGYADPMSTHEDTAPITYAEALTVTRAMLDAALLITIHVGGGCIDRDVAPLPQRRWNRATSLLRFAGLARGRRVELQLKPTPEATLKALQDATEAARRNPAQWAAYMPAYNRAAALQRPRAKVAAMETR